MSDDGTTDLDRALGRLIFEIFRVNGRLLAAADDLVAPLGLTAARWQVLWAIAMAPAPQPVAHLARSMGLNRQGVQRIVNELLAEGLLELGDNPNHKRARLFAFPQKGAELYAAAEARRVPWLHGLSAESSVAALDGAVAVLRSLRDRLVEPAEPPS